MPTYNLKAVVLETGLKPDTLRAWERRYGLPNPQRTEGGHRLYSQKDINMLKWLMARQKDGLSISRAIDLWKQLDNEDKNPLHELPLELPRESAIPQYSTGASIIDLRETWVSACNEFDEKAAENILNHALAMYPAEVVCFEVLQKGLAEIGMGWYEGRVTAQQEHFASGLAMRRLQALVAASPAPTRTSRILIGCAPEEEHTFPALLLTLILRRRGWEALYLGANVPTARLEATIAAADPQLAIFTAQTLPTAATLLSMAEILQQEKVVLAFGGLIFNHMPALNKRIPGHYLGNRLEDSVSLIEQLIKDRATSLPPVANSLSPIYKAALQHFSKRQSKLESVVWELFLDSDIHSTHLAKVNHTLSRYIMAALSLGDIGLVGPDIDWLKGLLFNSHYRFPKEAIDNYFEIYANAAKQILSTDGQIIIDWLNRLITADQSNN